MRTQTTLEPISDRYPYLTEYYYKASGSDKQDVIYMTQYHNNLLAQLKKKSITETRAKELTNALNNLFNNINKIESSEEKMAATRKRFVNITAAQNEAIQAQERIKALLKYYKESYGNDIIKILQNTNFQTFEADIEKIKTKLNKYGNDLSSLAKKNDYKYIIDAVSYLNIYIDLLEETDLKTNFQNILYNIYTAIVKEINTEVNVLKTAYRYILVNYGEKKAAKLGINELKKQIKALNPSIRTIKKSNTTPSLNIRKSNIIKLNIQEDSKGIHLHANVITKVLNKVIKTIRNNFDNIVDIDYNFEDLLLKNDFKFHYINMISQRIKGGVDVPSRSYNAKGKSVAASRKLAQNTLKLVAAHQYIQDHNLNGFYYHNKQFKPLSALVDNLQIENITETPFSLPIKTNDERFFKKGKSWRDRAFFILALVHKQKLGIANGIKGD